MGKFLGEIKGQPVGKNSSIDLIIAKLGESDGKDLLDALHDPTIRPIQIVKALQARQIKLSASIVTRYRQANDVA